MTTQQQRNGLYIFGQLKGIKETPWTDDDGNNLVSYKLGIAILADDGYGGKKEDVIELKINPNIIGNVRQQCNSLIGKYVYVNCFYNNGTYKSLNFPNDGIITPIPPKQSDKAS